MPLTDLCDMEMGNGMKVENKWEAFNVVVLEYIYNFVQFCVLSIRKGILTKQYTG